LVASGIASFFMLSREKAPEQLLDMSTKSITAYAQQNQDLNLAANGAIDSGENQNIINPIKWWRYFFN